MKLSDKVGEISDSLFICCVVEVEYQSTYIGIALHTPTQLLRSISLPNPELCRRNLCQRISKTTLLSPLCNLSFLFIVLPVLR